MADFPHLDYLDGRPSPPGLPGCATFTACITWTEKLHCLHYPDGQPSLPGPPSLPGRPGWTTFAYLYIA
eukprot:4614344-Karenia_brevis.AAC.1